jgi:hypothetical protein
LGNGQSEDVALGDLNGDGDLDAFVANGYGSQANGVWLNNGAGDFSGHGVGSFDGGGSQQAYYLRAVYASGE